MDELLTNAYRDLTDSALPPPDATMLVTERRAQRRRSRQVRSAVGAGTGMCAVAAVVLLSLIHI